jgi:rhodanese-related sulfurtransferase
VSDPTITPTELRNVLSEAKPPLLLDVRRKPTFDAASDMIPGALWRDPYAIGAWAGTLPSDRDIVVYCAHGLEIGRGVRELLFSIFKESGRQVRYLQGGIEQWTLDGGPTVAKANRK